MSQAKVGFDKSKQVKLPESYYLDHFLHVVRLVVENYPDFIESTEKKFVSDFEELGCDEQRLFVRMANRSGTIFLPSDLQYSEITSLDSALLNLVERNFIRRPSTHDFEDCLAAFSRENLARLIPDTTLRVKSLNKRDLIRSILQDVAFESFQKTLLYQQVYIQNHESTLEYFYFLILGELHNNLQIYALRDLGLRKTNSWKIRAFDRFTGPPEARSEFLLKKLQKKIRRIRDLKNYDELLDDTQWPEAIGAEAGRTKEKIAWEAAHFLTEKGRSKDALRILFGEDSDRAIEKRIRILFSLGETESARAELEAILKAPPSSSILLFADDFYSRKFGGKRLSSVTHILRDAGCITLDGMYRGNTERGAKEYFTALGYKVYRSENYLWTALFGILFWDILFESDTAAIHSEFDRMPADLARGDFYVRNEFAIEQRLDVLADANYSKHLIQDVLTTRFGTSNGVFRWHPVLKTLLAEFVEESARNKASFLPILKEMSKNFLSNRKGFPDLLLFKDGALKFIEIKAQGDALSRDQLRQIMLLSDCGYASEVVNVAWKDEIERSYVVVDVETTGGTPHQERITEIGAVKVKNGVVGERFSTLVNPQKKIPSRIVSLTGITDAMVASAPAFSEIADEFLEFVGNDTLVSHSVRFDYGFIAAEFRRLSIPFKRTTFCTCVEARRAYPKLPSHSLKNLCENFGIELTNHHRALADASATALLFLKILGFSDRRAS